jgi:membrane protease YdiL (CAAX protease family)
MGTDEAPLIGKDPDQRPVTVSSTGSTEENPEPKSFRQVVEADSVSPVPAMAPQCPRCGKLVVGEFSICPFCDARLRGPVPSVYHAEPRGPFVPRNRRVVVDSESTIAVTRLLFFYLLLLATNVIGHMIVESWHVNQLPKNVLIDHWIRLIVTMEGIDAVILAIALVSLPWPPKLPISARWRQTAGWLSGPFVLSITLGLNFAYHFALRSYVQFPEWIHGRFGMPLGWEIATTCVQPAIVEELIFRYLALGTLTRVMSVSAAVWVSSIMFGMAHSGVALSIPILTIAGVCLGYVRVWSRSLALPMYIHALHNGIILYFESI